MLAYLFKYFYTSLSVTDLFKSMNSISNKSLFIFTWYAWS